MSMIKIGMIGIAAVFLALLLKKEKGELALLVGIAASVLIFGYTLSRISFILDFLRELMDTLPVDPALLKALLKMLGITYVADFSASVCRKRDMDLSQDRLNCLQNYRSLLCPFRNCGFCCG